MTTITSRRHSIVSQFRDAARGGSGRALLDGWHLLHDAIDAHVAIEVVAIAGEARDPFAEQVLARLESRTETLSVSTHVMNALSPVRTPTGVAAIVRPRVVEISDLLQPAPALIVAAADLQDPGNVGAVVRSAEAGGATGALFTGESADPWGWKALRGAMGSTFRLPIIKVLDSATAYEALQQAGVRLIAAVPRDGTAMHEVDLRSPAAVILGGEGGGLSATVLKCVDERLSIPMQAPVESLNAAVAAALIVYEARRQRLPGLKPGPSLQGQRSQQ